jgi:hypothetical protein
MSVRSGLRFLGFGPFRLSEGVLRVGFVKWVGDFVAVSAQNEDKYGDSTSPRMTGKCKCGVLPFHEFEGRMTGKKL